MTNSWTQSDVADSAMHLCGKRPEAVLSWAAETFSGAIRLASSMGLEDQVLTHMICTAGLEIPIFTLDTGRLFNETYELIERTEQRYGIRIAVYFPERKDVEEMVAKRGINLFLESVEKRKECCRVRKIVPLRRALDGLGAWVCGLRREQSDAREDVLPLEWDAGNSLAKVNPLVDWTFDEVKDYAREHDVPYSPLQDQGYVSIGCACCTRATDPDECFRAGRWWWEDEEHKECGLHWVDGKLVRPGSAFERRDGI